MRHAHPTEHDEQKALWQWSRQMLSLDPRVGMLVSIPNAAKRSYKLASYLRSEGLSKGFPDLMLACPNNGYHGLFIELKRKDGKPSPEQMAWLESLRNHGYQACVCWGADEAIATIKEYLGIR